MLVQRLVLLVRVGSTLVPSKIKVNEVLNILSVWPTKMGSWGCSQQAFREN